jgi:MFS family permease
MTSARAARNAVAATFFLNGLLFATWVARIPEARSSLGLDNGQLGLLLLAIAVGSMAAMPSSGALIERFDAAGVIRVAGAATLVGLSLVAVAIIGGATWLAAGALCVYGAGTGVWDVAMNVEGASVERRLERSIMPRFHAAWSLGSVAGAGLGAAAVAVGVPILVHVVPVALAGLVGVVFCARSFLASEQEEKQGPEPSVWSAWREPRTLLIGLMMLALALTEGTANDWLALALVDGHDAERWVGVSGFGVFVAAMTAGRFVGPLLLDRFGRLPMLWGTMVMAGGGVLLIVLASHPALIVTGIILWGLGASLGFPVGISAAADAPGLAAARVSVVSTLGYAAFFAGPPLIGFVAERVGTLNALLVVVAVLVPSALAVPSARKPSRLVA